MKYIFKLSIGILLTAAAAAALLFVLYLKMIPALCTSQNIHKKINLFLSKQAGISYTITNPELKTSLSPNVSFKTDRFELVKNNEKVILLQCLNTEFSLSRLLFHKIKIKTLGADYIFVDINKLSSLAPKSKTQKKSLWAADFFDSLLYVKNMKIICRTDNNTSVSVNAKNLSIDNAQKKCKFVRFDFAAMVKNRTGGVNISIADKGKVYIKKKCLYVDNCPLKINNSIININANAHQNKNYELKVSSDNFAVENAADIIKTNLIIPNGAEILGYFKDIKGNTDFNIKLKNGRLSGDIDLNKLYLIFVPVNNVPVNLEKGCIAITDKEIKLSDFSGYYGTREINKLKFDGSIKDYFKTFDTNIAADAVITNDFSKFYLSEMIGYDVGIKGKADTKLMLKSVNGIVDLTWLFKVAPECDLLVGGEPLGKYRVERVIVSKMKILGSKLHIDGLDYFVTVPNVKRFTKRRILSLNGIIDFQNGVDFKEMGFDITEPMPSEFLNMVIRSDFFRKGTVLGKLKAVSGEKGVKLFGDLTLNKIAVPSQRLFIEKGTLKTDFNTVNISSEGKYRRSAYNLEGNFENNIAFPIIVNNIGLSIDEIDIEKLLHSFNQQGSPQTQTQTQPQLQTQTQAQNDDDGGAAFDLSNLIVKKCTFDLKKGSYKLINFGDLHADLSLNEKTQLILDSNKFDFAEGHSSCHVFCDIKNHKYHVVLGAKDVNSDIIASSLLGIEKEISGLASGIIDIHTDKSLKLNGEIKFLVKDGTIGQVGLIEYILKVASVFRNPFAMVSPATIFDLMNIPDGSFEKIQGTLLIKNNVIERIKIKSFARELSAYIAGRYDLENKDASLRIYTRLSNKNKGIFGILRKISLGSIASRVSLGAKNEASYYSAELSELPSINADESDCQIFLTKIDGDVEHNNFISSLKKLK